MSFKDPQPNDSPMARCSDGHTYNPYKHGLGECPHCDN